LANSIWVVLIVSPRVVSTPAADATVVSSPVTTSAGTDLSTSSATLSLLMAPGATLVSRTFLLTP
jgi:hypothetical protein